MLPLLRGCEGPVQLDDKSRWILQVFFGEGTSFLMIDSGSDRLWTKLGTLHKRSSGSAARCVAQPNPCIFLQPRNQECDQRLEPSEATALATPPPKLPSGRDTLPRFLPPPPRPSTFSEVRKLPSPQQAQPKPAQAFCAQEKLRPNKAEDDEKDSWSWWKGHWWDWDSQEKNDVEVEQGHFFGYLC